VLWIPEHRASASNWKEIQRPARKLGVQLHSRRSRAASSEKAFADAMKARDDAHVITPNPSS